ncbi:MAG: hypothetical protein Q7S99_13915 [Parvibaculum sp.]|nr:hypothetical protein [Parvibaculum sp.]|tara:strand:- start:1475 stop:2311 length:837 start_codon:yes stop_codon:yes gene_type:complete
MAEQEPQAPKALVPKAQVSGRRIVVGLDTSFMSREALALAARVAASVDADLNGIFVEDENLLALSALPFAREISMAGAVSQMSEADMLRAMQAQAQIARRILERTAKEANIGWHFDIARGHRLAALAHHANADDTLVIRAHDASRRDVGRTIRAATREVRADVLLAARGVAVATTFATPDLRTVQTVLPERVLLAVDEGSSPGEACVGFAQTLAARVGAPFRRLFARGFAPADLAIAARKAHAGLIVINAHALGDDDDAAHLSAAAGCPVLLLGGERK